MYCAENEAGNFTWVDSTIYSGTPTKNVWFDVNTGIKGRSLCVFDVWYYGGSGNRGLAVRRNGDTRSWLDTNAVASSGALYSYGVSAYAKVGAGFRGYIVTACDINGDVEFYPYSSSGAASLEVQFLGYVQEELSSPVVVSQYPEGSVSGSLTKIGCVIDDDFGMDLTTMNFYCDLPNGIRLYPVLAGVIQTGWEGNLIYNGSDPTRVELQITGWPDSIKPGLLVGFGIDAENIVGLSL
jgi:hypothetical protein